VFQGTSKKAQGSEGICLEIFKANWKSIQVDVLELFKQMYIGGRIMEQQKQGTVVSIPKTSAPTTPADYKPITLLKQTRYWHDILQTDFDQHFPSCYIRVIIWGARHNGFRRGGENT
jgi:hypothetical protein